MAKVKRKISKKAKIALVSALCTLLAAGIVIACILLFPPKNTQNSGGGTQGGTTTDTTPVPVTNPLPTSNFVSQGKTDVFTYDLYEDYAIIRRAAVGQKSLTVPADLEGKKVMAIAENAFANSSVLEQVVLPDTIVEIGNYAFYSCTALKEISLPDSVYEVGDYAFSDCESLKTVTLSRGVKNIGTYAFDNTAFLNEVKDDFVILGDGILVAYKGKGGSITLPSDVKKISSLSLCETLTALYIPTGVTEIGDYALAGCSNLATLVIPDTVTYVGEKAFSCCSMLTGVRLGEGVTTLGDGAFAFCDNLKSVSFPKALTDIGENLFEETKLLETLYVSPDSKAEEYFKSTVYASLVIADEE
ncbi:MAG: leucine-rich repeat domain-containing protein [Clostridia bacterium]|nr:leucine-rich repeat domain-containing protein [Clostridia bacterium]